MMKTNPAGPHCDSPLTTWSESTVGASLTSSARNHASREALRWPTPSGLNSVTYAHVHAAAQNGARRLRAVTDPSQPVAVFGPNSVDWFIAFWAVALSGRPLVPINPALSDAEVVHQLNDCQAAVVIAAPVYRDRDLVVATSQMQDAVPSIRAVFNLETWIEADASTVTTTNDPWEVQPTDPFLIQYTSGTTGRPKGAVLSHRACVNSGRTLTALLEPSDHEIWCSPMPLHHVGASVAHAVALAEIGGTYVMLSAFSPSVMMHAAQASKATLLAGVPTVYLGIMEDPTLATIELPSLRVLMLGGTSIAPSLVSRMEDHFGAHVAVLYGQSEAPAITQTRLDDSPAIKAETIGRALPHREVQIQSLEGTEVPAGVVGEICVRTSIRMDEYLGRPEATRATIDAQHWLHTGDLGSLDANGLVRFHGRVKEVVMRGGENVYAREVENAIASLTGVSQAAVIGVPDEKWGEVVAAVVTVANGSNIDEDRLREHVESTLAYFKRPERWLIVDSLPMTASGKLQKFKLSKFFTPGTDL